MTQNQKQLSKEQSKTVEEYLSKGKNGKPFTQDGQKFRRNIINDFLSKYGNGHVTIQKTESVKSTPHTKTDTSVKYPSNSSVNVVPVNGKEYVLDECPEYKAFNGEDQIIKAHLEGGIPLLLVGPKGVGKTLVIANYAHRKKIPIIQFDCSENSKRTDLIGRFRLEGEQVVFELGILAKAIEVANQMGIAILVLEELNALTPQMQKVLNQLLDWRKHVHVPEIGQIYTLQNGAQLLICGTQNPTTYGGVHELNEDLLSRWGVWRWNYPKEAHEKEIISTEGVSEDIVKKLLTLSKDLRAGVSDNNLEYALSPRDEVKFLQLYKQYAKAGMKDQEALKTALDIGIIGLYEVDNHVETVKARIRSAFNVDMGGRV